MELSGNYARGQVQYRAGFINHAVPQRVELSCLAFLASLADSSGRGNTVLDFGGIA